jgi:hypothetical protein
MSVHKCVEKEKESGEGKPAGIYINNSGFHCLHFGPRFLSFPGFHRQSVAWLPAGGSTQPTRIALYLLLGAVDFVPLISCTNVASLLLSEATTRQREMAVRAALDASRTRLIREVLTESILLAAFGGLLKILLAFWRVKAVIAAAPERIVFIATRDPTG